MKKILITGSAGLVGSACVDFFTSKGWEVIGIDNNARSKNLGTPEKSIEKSIDFTKADEVFPLFREHKFDAIIHAGGQASHDWSNEHVLEDFLTNALGTVLLLEATRAFCPEAVFVYVSSDKVYGENMSHLGYTETGTRYTSERPFKEDLGLDFAGHRSPFGVSKTAADLYVQEYGNTFGIKTVCFRPGCITGKSHEGAELHGFLAYLAKCIRTSKTYKIFGYEGKQVRDQIHAHDLASAFWHFIENPKIAAVYNIGGGPERSVSVLEAIDLIEQETGKKADYEFHEKRPGDRQWDVHSVAKFKEDYPEWDYTYDLPAIIKDICEKEI